MSNVVTPPPAYTAMHCGFESLCGQSVSLVQLASRSTASCPIGYVTVLLNVVGCMDLPVFALVCSITYFLLASIDSQVPSVPFNIVPCY
jgi:hypothetical protein